MKQYLESLSEVRHVGSDREDRTGVGTRSVFGGQLRFDLAEGFPLVTTKKVFLKGVIHELLWFIKGDTNVAYLQENGVHIWDDWADTFGNLGPIYGYQWRNFGGVDQLQQVIEQIKKDPGSRRHVISAWNPMDIEDMALPPCHVMFQFYVSWGKLSCHMYQRSADMFLGVPFNIASYALLTMMIARVCGLGDGELIMSFGDRHIYHNHFDQVDEQLLREPRNLPRLHVAPDVFNIEDYRETDIVLSNYNPHPAIKAPIAV